ncbi:MAG: response regulator [Gemmatimonadota bacterium]
MSSAGAELPPLILVADDVDANVELLADQLAVLGFRTVAAYDGPGSVAACFEHHPDLCILDVSMPAGELGVADRDTGFEVCRRIKRDARTARIPVIFVTALNDTADRVKAIEAGGDDFLLKPHNRLVLGARVRSLLKLKGATDALEESYRKLRELAKVRDDLMKMIVHDLKTPLTSVLATLEMLREGDYGPMVERQYKAVSEAEGKAEEGHKNPSDDPDGPNDFAPDRVGKCSRKNRLHRKNDCRSCRCGLFLIPHLYRKGIERRQQSQIGDRTHKARCQPHRVRRQAPR